MTSPRNIIEASGQPPDIIGHSDFFIKLSVLETIKKVNCLVLRGNDIDREILISGQILKEWRMIQPTFPNESLDLYTSKNILDSNQIKAIYEKSLISTKERGYGPPVFVCLACNIHFMQKEDIFVSSVCEIFLLTWPFYSIHLPLALLVS